jgi:MFS family permease
LYVPPLEAKFYGTKQPFGSEVENMFPGAISDIEESGDCIALGKSTAAVFHLMRIMERGVQAFGSKMGVTNTSEKKVWGVLSAMTMWVESARSFYQVRFLLGVVESGFFPGVILYLTFWYPERHRARMVAMFMSAIPLSGVIAGPISGWIMARTSGAANLRAWQWLFLLEGLPACVAGVVALVVLTDSPAHASWLKPAERELLVHRLAEEKAGKALSRETHHSPMEALRSAKIWLFGLIYFGFVMGNYALGFWLPQVIGDTITKNPLAIGWLSVIPWGSGAVAMIVVGRHSDATRERRMHIALVRDGGCSGVRRQCNTRYLWSDGFNPPHLRHNGALCAHFRRSGPSLQ